MLALSPLGPGAARDEANQSVTLRVRKPSDPKVSRLVDELLLQIYGSAGSRRQSVTTTCTPSPESDPGPLDFCWDFGERSTVRPDTISHSFQAKSKADLRRIVTALRTHVEHAGSTLVKQLRRRDALMWRHERHCDVITALLQAQSLKRRQDTRLRFSVAPLPGDSGFTQWHDAMKMVARLPGGIPQEFRRRLWLTLAEKHLQARGIDWNQAERACFNEWSNPDDDELGIQIVKDLHRTGCSLFCGAAGERNQALLKRVLLAYARWNKAVGYCQGFNMLAALILQVMERSEADSVKVMIYLIEGVLPESYFANNLRGLSVDMAVFRDLLRMRLPALSKHLEHLQSEAGDATGTSYEPPLTNVFTMQWFLTLFSNCLPQATVLRVWDLVFLEGNEVLLRTALAIWATLEDRIMAVESADEFYSIMGVLTREMLEFGLMDPNNLVKAMVSVAPFPFPELPELRDRYTYNITPWSHSVSNVARRGLRLFHSDEDEEDAADDEKMAVAAAFGISAVFRNSPRRRASLTALTPAVTLGPGPGSGDKDRLNLDISALKQQYSKLRERQRQAHIILTAACARPSGPSARQVATPSTAPVVMNHLLLGRSALLRRGGGPGPVPAHTALHQPQQQQQLQQRTPRPSSSRPVQPKTGTARSAPESGETLHWRDARRRPVNNDATTQDTTEKSPLSPLADDTATQASITSSSCGLPRSRSSSSSSTTSSASSPDSSCSSSTELCDEPDRLSDFDNEDVASLKEHGTPLKEQGRAKLRHLSDSSSPKGSPPKSSGELGATRKESGRAAKIRHLSGSDKSSPRQSIASIQEVSMEDINAVLSIKELSEDSLAKEITSPILRPQNDNQDSLTKDLMFKKQENISSDFTLLSPVQISPCQSPMDDNLSSENKNDYPVLNFSTPIRKISASISNDSILAESIPSPIMIPQDGAILLPSLMDSPTRSENSPSTLVLSEKSSPTETHDSVSPSTLLSLSPSQSLTELVKNETISPLIFSDKSPSFTQLSPGFTEIAKAVSISPLVFTDKTPSPTQTSSSFASFCKPESISPRSPEHTSSENMSPSFADITKAGSISSKYSEIPANENVSSSFAEISESDNISSSFMKMTKSENFSSNLTTIKTETITSSFIDDILTSFANEEQKESTKTAPLSQTRPLINFPSADNTKTETIPILDVSESSISPDVFLDESTKSSDVFSSSEKPMSFSHAPLAIRTSSIDQATSPIDWNKIDFTVEKSPPKECSPDLITSHWIDKKQSPIKSPPIKINPAADAPLIVLDETSHVTPERESIVSSPHTVQGSATSTPLMLPLGSLSASLSSPSSADDVTLPDLMVITPPRELSPLSPLKSPTWTKDPLPQWEAPKFPTFPNPSPIMWEEKKTESPKKILDKCESIKWDVSPPEEPKAGWNSSELPAKLDSPVKTPEKWVPKFPDDPLIWPSLHSPTSDWKPTSLGLSPEDKQKSFISERSPIRRERHLSWKSDHSPDRKEVDMDWKSTASPLRSPESPRKSDLSWRTSLDEPWLRDSNIRESANEAPASPLTSLPSGPPESWHSLPPQFPSLSETKEDISKVRKDEKIISKFPPIPESKLPSPETRTTSPEVISNSESTPHATPPSARKLSSNGSYKNGTRNADGRAHSHDGAESKRADRKRWTIAEPPSWSAICDAMSLQQQQGQEQERPVSPVVEEEEEVASKEVASSDRGAFGRRNSERALQIIQENSEILQRIMRESRGRQMCDTRASRPTSIGLSGLGSGRGVRWGSQRELTSEVPSSASPPTLADSPEGGHWKPPPCFPNIGESPQTAAPAPAFNPFPARTRPARDVGVRLGLYPTRQLSK